MESRTILRLLVSSIMVAGCGNMLGTPKDKAKTSEKGDIEDDPNALPPIVTKGDLRPSFSFLHAKGNRIALNLLGMVDLKSSQPIDFRANESVFVVEDGRLQGIRITQNSQSNSLPVDIVFAIDNSGSMDEEANGVADKAIDFAKFLAASGIDVRLGVVGFDGEISGAIDLAVPADVAAYLSRPGMEGADRSRGYAGFNTQALEAAARALNMSTGFTPGSENHIAALVYAEKSFAWRTNAQRVFYTFSDETNTDTLPGQHPAWNGQTDYQISSFCSRWKPSFGTIHTIWSGDNFAFDPQNPNYLPEDPRSLAGCTGGTVTMVASDASDLDLTQVNSTLAVANSAMVEFISDSALETHTIDVIVKTADGSDGKTTLRLKYK